MLFAGNNDPWAPTFHMTDIARLQAQSILSSNIFMTYLPELQHDYVSHKDMSAQVVGWSYQCISSIAMYNTSLLSWQQQQQQHQQQQQQQQKNGEERGDKEHVLVPILSRKTQLRAKL
jgi:hypothetical protein